MKDEKKNEEVVHYLDLGKFAESDEKERREMIRQMLIAIRRKGDGDVKG